MKSYFITFQLYCVPADCKLGDGLGGIKLHPHQADLPGAYCKDTQKSLAYSSNTKCVGLLDVTT